MDNEQYIESGLSVGTVKIANKYEIFTEEEVDIINNKIPELDERVGVIEDEIEEINSSLDNIENEKATKQEVEIERKRIDNLAKLEEGSTTGDAELIDGRVAYDGSVYENIGGAIRNQNNYINSKIDDISNNLDIKKNYMVKTDFTADKYWNYYQNSFRQSSTSGMYICKIEKVQKGTYYISKCKGYFTWTEKISTKEVNKLTATDEYYNGEIIITEPTNIYITINKGEYDSNDIYFTNYLPLINPTQKGIISLKIKDPITKNETDFLDSSKNLIDRNAVQVGKYFNGKGSNTGSNAGYCCISIPVEKNRSYSSSVVHSNFTFFKSYSTGSVTRILDTSTQLGYLENYIPQEDGYLMLSTSANQINDFMLVDSHKLPDKYIPYDTVYDVKLYGLNIPTEEKYYDNEENVYYRINTITVAKDGTGDFDNPIDAYNSITYNSKTNRHKIIVKQGVYDFGEKFNSTIGTGSIGIVLTKKYVYFEGENPENTILYFDGCPSGTTQITNEQAFRVAIFHFGLGAFKGYIKGFTLRTKNCRYALHPETSGQGNGGNWLVENCIFDFLGNPNVVSWRGASVGIGISRGEKGYFRRCKWTNYSGSVEGLVGHNNPFDYTTKPTIIPSCELIFEECDFGNTIIHIDNIYTNNGFNDIFRLKNCINIARGYFGHQNGQTENIWKCIKEATKITIDEFDY